MSKKKNKKVRQSEPACIRTHVERHLASTQSFTLENISDALSVHGLSGKEIRETLDALVSEKRLEQTGPDSWRH